MKFSRVFLLFQDSSSTSLIPGWRTTPAGLRWWGRWGRATPSPRAGATTTTPPTSDTTRGRPPCQGTHSLLSVPTPLPLTRCCQQHLLPHHPQVGWFSSKSSFWQILEISLICFVSIWVDKTVIWGANQQKKVFDSFNIWALDVLFVAKYESVFPFEIVLAVAFPNSKSEPREMLNPGWDKAKC